MGKSKRNCRRTEDEILIHEKAVKMRKMTDEQLVCSTASGKSGKPRRDRHETADCAVH